MLSRGTSGRHAGGTRLRQLVWLGAWVATIFPAAFAEAAGTGDDVARRGLARRGQELFTREFVPGDPGGHSGDGLGPMYNDTSCVACHNQGGVGGAGPSSKNVDFLTAVVTPVEDEAGVAKGGMFRLRARWKAAGRAFEGTGVSKPRAKGEAPDRGPLVELHGGFRDGSSVVVHRFGRDPNYESRRLQMLNPIFGSLALAPVPRVFGSAFDEAQAVEREMAAREHNFPFGHELGHFTLIPSERNPAALFGAGVIDAVPDTVLEATARRGDARFPEVKGRVCRLPGGRIGRFGWKADQASLDDFVLTACAVELGLEVPARHQGVKPENPDYRSPGLDLSRGECDALVAFVASLPAPVERRPMTWGEAAAIKSGRETFERIGCAACHRPKLGSIDGIYSDLLLHEMGNSLGSNSSYGSFLPAQSEEEGPLADSRFPSGPDAFCGGPPRPTPATSREWRTPPLWGIRDSAPYLHDGRADTIEEAIALHAGEGERSKLRYFELKPQQRLDTQSFLKSLVAPGSGNDAAAPASERPFLTLTSNR